MAPSQLQRGEPEEETKSDGRQRGREWRGDDCGRESKSSSMYFGRVPKIITGNFKIIEMNRGRTIGHLLFHPLGNFIVSDSFDGVQFATSSIPITVQITIPLAQVASSMIPNILPNPQPTSGANQENIPPTQEDTSTIAGLTNLFLTHYSIFPLSIPSLHQTPLGLILVNTTIIPQVHGDSKFLSFNHISQSLLL